MREILAEKGVRARISPVPIKTDGEVWRPRLPGSSTLRVDGRDLFPSPQREV